MAIDEVKRNTVTDLDNIVSNNSMITMIFRVKVIVFPGVI